jgi:hypothetical protein
MQDQRTCWIGQNVCTKEAISLQVQSIHPGLMSLQKQSLHSNSNALRRCTRFNLLHGNKHVSKHVRGGGGGGGTHQQGCHEHNALAPSCRASSY